MDQQKPLVNENQVLKTLTISSDSSSEQATAMISRAVALKILNERKRRLRAVRSEHGISQLEKAVALAQALGYDTSKNWGQKAVAYLMRLDVRAVRKLIEPDVVPHEEDAGSIDVDQLLADALKL